jgi:hypothetical protein
MFININQWTGSTKKLGNYSEEKQMLEKCNEI